MASLRSQGGLLNENLRLPCKDDDSENAVLSHLCVKQGTIGLIDSQRLSVMLFALLDGSCRYSCLKLTGLPLLDLIEETHPNKMLRNLP